MAEVKNCGLSERARVKNCKRQEKLTTDHEQSAENCQDPDGRLIEIGSKPNRSKKWKDVQSVISSVSSVSKVLNGNFLISVISVYQR